MDMKSMSTTTNTICEPLKCDIEIAADKVLHLIANDVDSVATDTYCENALMLRSCQDRIGVVVGFAIDLMSYIIGTCAHFGWQSVHTIYCTKFIRINRRALIGVLLLGSARFKENIKAVGQAVTENVKRNVGPIVKMLKRKKYVDENGESHQACSDSWPQAIEGTQQNSNGNNNNNNNNNNSNNDADECSESDSVSLEILWQPQTGTSITADVIFIHGLHGSIDSTWKQGEWMCKPQTVADKCIQIKRQDKNNNAGNFEKDITYHQIETLKANVANTTNDTTTTVATSNTLENTTDRCFSMSNSLSQCWPKDWLPLDFPSVRICAINYDTDPHLWRPIWYPKRKRSNLAIRAMKMIKVLVEHEIGVQRPIVWVGHSKGGLYIKQIIVNAHAHDASAATQWLWKSSRAVLFYSVPHRGSPLADLNLPLLTRSIEMIEIQKNFSTIIDLHRRFVTMCKKGILNMDVFSFIEMKFTELSVFYLRIIGVDSGDPGIGDVCKVPLDHLDVCKPRNRNCLLYRQLADMINSAIHTFNTFN